MFDETRFIHEIIFDDLKAKILSHQYPIGSQLPKEMDLMKIYSASRHTIRKALDRLKTEGYLYTVKGSGTFIQEKKAEYILSKMNSYSEIIQSQNGEPSSIVLSAKLITPPNHVNHALQYEDNAKCYFVERLRKNGDILMCYERTYISPSLCPDIDLYVAPNISLYNLYEKRYDLKMGTGEYHLEAINADKEISSVLKIKENEAVLLMRATIKLLTGEPLYYIDAYYVGSRYTFSTFLQR